MPDGKTHKLVGAGTGAVYASLRAKEQTVTNCALKLLEERLADTSGAHCRMF